MSTIRNRLFGVITPPVSKPVISQPSGNTAILPKATQPAQALTKNNSAKAPATPVSGSSSTHIPISIVNGNREQVSQKNRIQVSNVSAGAHIPISIVNGDRELAFRQSSSENEDGDSSQNQPNNRTPYIPISVVTGSRDIASVSADLRAYLQSGSSPLTNAIPKEHADLSNLVEKAGESIDFKDWADKTTRQQQAIVQKSGLSGQDQMSLLNAASYYVETIAKVRDLFAHRDAYGLTLTDANKLAKELFNIADERDEATRRVGKYANDAVFAPRALRYLDEQEDKLLAGIGMSTNDTGRSAWYNGKNSATAAKQTAETKNAESGDYIQVPKQTAFGPESNNPAVNCYGYVLMYLGIQPVDGNYDIQPGQLSEKNDGDHAHVETPTGPLNTDITSITNYIIRDVEQAGENIRVIDSYKDANEDETVVALKTTQPFFIGSLDYHCLVQLQDGTWADKQGTANDSRQGVITNPDADWVSNWKKYNSETIYFAISKE